MSTAGSPSNARHRVFGSLHWKNMEYFGRPTCRSHMSPILQSLTYHLHTPILQIILPKFLKSDSFWSKVCQNLFQLQIQMLRFTSQHPIQRSHKTLQDFWDPRTHFRLRRVRRLRGLAVPIKCRRRMGDLFILQIWSIFFWKSKVLGKSVVFPEDQVLESNALCWSFNIWANMSWLVVDLPFWQILVKWDHYSQSMGKNKMFQTTNQMRVSGAGKTHCTSCGTRIIGMWSMTKRMGKAMGSGCVAQTNKDADLTSLK